MPQPLSQRKELLFVLKKLVELRSVDDAIPVIEGKNGEGREDWSVGQEQGLGEGGGKRHLWWILPLVEKAIGVAGRDGNGSVLRAMGEVLGAVVDGGEGMEQ